MPKQSKRSAAEKKGAAASSAPPPKVKKKKASASKRKSKSGSASASSKVATTKKSATHNTSKGGASKKKATRKANKGGATKKSATRNANKGGATKKKATRHASKGGATKKSATRKTNVAATTAGTKAAKKKASGVAVAKANAHSSQRAANMGGARGSSRTTATTTRPLIGAHMSIAGGLYKALERGAACECDIVQLFTKSNNQWKAKALTADDLAAWNEARRTLGVEPAIAHDSYLINLASPDGALFEKSVEAFAVEVARCSLLGIPYLCMHPGAHMQVGEAAGLRRCAEGLDLSLECAVAEEARLAAELGVTPKPPVVLVETTAGQGTSLGYRFEQIRDLLGMVAEPARYGVCVDTCHIFAAGYDIRDLEGYLAVMEEFDVVIGLEHLKAFHLNDSKKPLGSRVDRHEHIGKGEIGVEPFRALMGDPRFFGLPMALETPKGDDKGGGNLDQENLALLRSMWPSA